MKRAFVRVKANCVDCDGVGAVLSKPYLSRSTGKTTKDVKKCSNAKCVDGKITVLKEVDEEESKADQTAHP